MFKGARFWVGLARDENFTKGLTDALKLNAMLVGHCTVDTSFNAAATRLVSFRFFTIFTDPCAIKKPVSQIYPTAFFQGAVNPR